MPPFQQHHQHSNLSPSTSPSETDGDELTDAGAFDLRTNQRLQSVRKRIGQLRKASKAKEVTLRQHFPPQNIHGRTSLACAQPTNASWKGLEDRLAAMQAAFGQAKSPSKAYAWHAFVPRASAPVVNTHPDHTVVTSAKPWEASIKRMSRDTNAPPPRRYPKRIRRELVHLGETQNWDTETTQTSPDSTLDSSEELGSGNEATESRGRGRPPRQQSKVEHWNFVSDHIQGSSALVHFQRPSEEANIAVLLRDRELGGGLRSSVREYNTRLKETLERRELKCYKSWTGASKDLINSAWKPDGTTYAIGSSTEMDGMNVQYNKPNNLLYGDSYRDTLHELDAHHTEYLSHISNLSNPIGSRLYSTISAIRFSTNGSLMFTGSYDGTAKIWDTSIAGRPRCIRSVRHEGRVEMLDISRDSSYVATAQNTSQNSIKIFGLGELKDHSRLSSVRNAGDLGNSLDGPITTLSPRSKTPLFPTALRWGSLQETQHLLLAGFGENRPDDEGRDTAGDLLLWDINQHLPFGRLSSSAQHVFDVVWHPSRPICAVGSTPPGGALTYRKLTRSVVKIFQPLHGPSKICEYECPAFDINEVLFHPSSANYVLAACTDGATYAWDFRRPDLLLNRFAHGPSIEELDHNQSREQADTGVRFAAWSSSGTNFYSGSSDGIIKCWNPLVAPEDAFLEDVAGFDSAVMTGTFSPDFSNLLIGLCKGSVHLLSTSPWSHPGTSDDYFLRHIPAGATERSELDNPSTDAGRDNLEIDHSHLNLREESPSYNFTIPTRGLADFSSDLDCSSSESCYLENELDETRSWSDVDDFPSSMGSEPAHVLGSFSPPATQVKSESLGSESGYHALETPKKVVGLYSTIQKSPVTTESIRQLSERVNQRRISQGMTMWRDIRPREPEIIVID